MADDKHPHDGLNDGDAALLFGADVSVHALENLTAELTAAKARVTQADKLPGAERPVAIRKARQEAAKWLREGAEWLPGLQKTLERMRARALADPAVASNALFNGYLDRLSRAWADASYLQADLEALKPNE